MKTISLVVNDQLAYEYDRETALNEDQLGFLDKMDNDMGRGIKIQGEEIKSPDSRQRARFVAMNLIKALQQENEAAISVSWAYLATRLPGLLEVKVNDDDGKVMISLVEE